MWDEHLQRLSLLKEKGILIILELQNANKYVFGIFKSEDIENIRRLSKRTFTEEGIWTDLKFTPGSKLFEIVARPNWLQFDRHFL